MNQTDYYIGRIDSYINFKVALGDELNIFQSAIDSSRDLEFISKCFRINDKNSKASKFKRITNDFEYKKNKMWEFRSDINRQIDKIGDEAGECGISLSWTVPG